MSLVNLEEFEEFYFAFQELGYQMLAQNATDEEILESIKEILDEYSYDVVSEDSETMGLFDSEPDDRARAVAAKYWNKVGQDAIRYAKTYYKKELENNYGVNLDELENAIVSNMGDGVDEYFNEADRMKPSYRVTEDTDEWVKGLQEIVKSDDFRRE